MLKRTAILALGLLLLVLVTGGAVAADSQLGDTVDTHDEDMADVVGYMHLYGVDEDTATKEIGAVTAISALQDELERVAPDQFGGLWIDHSPYQVTVAVTEMTNDVEAALASTSLVEIPTVQLVDTPLLELEAAQTSLRTTDIEHNSYVDVRRGEIVVELLDGTDELFKKGARDITSLPITINVVRQLAKPAVYLYGGEGLYNWSGCPAGFTVRDHFVLGSRTGFLTAGHCYGATFSYYGSSLPYVDHVTAGNVDAMFRLDGNHQARYRFIYNQAQNTRPQMGTLSTVVGQGICKYGPQTMYTCGTVDTITFSGLSWVSNSYGFVRAVNCNSSMIAGGDSGGPVFFGNNAYGLVAGYQPGACGHDNVNMLIYGKITPAMNAFDVDLLIAP